MRKIIIAEKAAAANRISKILSSNKAKKNKVTKRFSSYEWSDFITIPLRGHIVQADFPDEYSKWSKKRIKELLEAPIVENVSAKSIAKYLKKKGGNADQVIVATDSDREGELIGREGMRFVKEANPEVRVKRARFSSLTEEEVSKAFEELGELDDNLADSAEARRDVDLLWGASLTRLISLLGHRYGKKYLSVGRVQTPVLKLIVDREKVRQKFKPQTYWEVKAKLFKKKSFEAEHEDVFKKKEELKKLLDKKISEMEVKKVKKTKRKLRRPTPFNTTSFLRACHNKFGYSPANSMRIAENLYLKGLISYPRTSNTVYPKSLDFEKILSKLAEKYSEANDFIGKKLNPSRGKKKSSDHPPIHPVGVPKKISGQNKKVYELVVNRFFATLAEDGLRESTRIDFDAKGHGFVSHGKKVLKMGWMKYYPTRKSRQKILPELEEEEKVEVKKIWEEEKETKPPNRYGASTLLKIMEENDLGTKSTRHSILQKLIYRNYVEPKTFVPNHISFALIDVLTKNCEIITNPEMTAQLEERMEKVASGKKSKESVINHSKKMLEKAIDHLLGKEEKVSEELREGLRKDKIICTCPKCGEGNMRIIRSRKTGKRFCGCSNYPKCSNGWPLPQKGVLDVMLKKCKECGTNKIQVRGGKRPWSFCPNVNCPSKDEKKDVKKEKKD